MPDRLIDDPTIPPPGCRNGEGSASILPYLVKTLAAKPMAVPAPAAAEPRRDHQDEPRGQEPQEASDPASGGTGERKRRGNRASGPSQA